jgi:hypothetical protein
MMICDVLLLFFHHLNRLLAFVGVAPDQPIVTRLYKVKYELQHQVWEN